MGQNSTSTINKFSNNGNGSSFFALNPKKTMNQYVHRIWEMEDGLPSNAIRAIAQTPDGFLWIGTENGLARFDGVSFTVFNKQNTTAFKSNTAYSFYIDKKGILWVGTYGGGLISYHNGVFENYTVQHGLLKSIIWSITNDHDENLWIGTNGGLLKLANGSFSTYTTKQGLSNDNVRAVLEDRKGRLWIGTLEGLNCFQNGKFTHYSTKDGLPNECIRCLVEDSIGKLWIGTQDGLSCFHNGKFINYTTENGLSSNYIWTLYPDYLGNLWIGTNNGLTRYTDNKCMVSIAKDVLPNGSIFSIFQDHQKNFWLGTGDGLSQFRNGSFTPCTTKEGLSHDMASTVYEDSKKSLWFGTMGGGLNQLSDGKFVHYSKEHGLLNDSVSALIEDLKGRLWTGTSRGLYYFDHEKFVAYTNKNGFFSNNIWALYPDSTGKLWIGTSGGLYCFDGEKFDVYTMKDGLSSNTVRFIYRDRHEKLWVGTNNGLNWFENGRFKTTIAEENLPQCAMASIYEDKDGVLWIGTWENGIYRYKKGKFARITVQQGLHDDGIGQILEDDNGYFWINSGKGIFRVKKEDLNQAADGIINKITCTTYGKEDGLKSAESNSGTQPSGWKAHDGRLWFPTAKGVAVVDPNHLEEDTILPPVYVMRLVADEHEIPLTDPIVLPPGTKRLEFHYTAPHFIAPQKMQFKYKLEGFDEDWIGAGARRIAYYTNLRPGAYTFKVIASNSAGLWNEEGAEIEFTLKPYFYQTKRFDFLLMASVAAGAFQFHRVRSKNLEKHAKQLETVVKERTKQLADANIKLENTNQKLETANQQLELLAATDPLTEIANRRFCNIFLEREWKRAIRNHEPLSLILIDVDHFKAYNDTYGHPQGDVCLKQVVKLIQSLISRPTDLVARYGGEEFLVVLTDTPPAAAQAIAERIRKAVEALQIPHDASPTAQRVTISAGTGAVIPASHSSLTQFLETVDQALYKAKQTGRNRVESAS